MSRKRIISILVAISIIVVSVMPFCVSAATAPKINATAKTLYVGDSYTVKVTGDKITSKSFTTSKKSVATVTSKGVVKAVKAGTATITATVKYKSGTATKTKKLACKITVKSFVTPKLNYTSKSVEQGKTFTLKSTGTHITSTTYTTSSKSIATVTTKGVVKGVKAGTATITATIKYTQAGKAKIIKKTCKVTVKAAPTTTKPATTTTTTTKPSTTRQVPVTDEEGWNNEIYKP